MIEWGLTPEEFDNVPEVVISRVKETREARARGQERKSNLDKAKLKHNNAGK